MSKTTPTNISASVRQQLLNLAAKEGSDPNVLWTRFAIERLLYRLSVSDYKDRFVLKGAVLFSIWSNAPQRPTMDLDLEGFGENSNAWIVDVFGKLCRLKMEENDGLTFNADSIQANLIRENMEYEGRRIKLLAYLGSVRIPLRVDIGFGDVITPAPEWTAFPVLLNMPVPTIRAYPMESVVAEKLHAMVVLGIANSRMKDFFDLSVLMQRHSFDGKILTKAIKATFERRGTPIPGEVPLALTTNFALDPAKRTQWKAFLRKNGDTEMVPDFVEVLTDLRRFLIPIIEAASGLRQSPIFWKPNGPWDRALVER